MAYFAFHDQNESCLGLSAERFLDIQGKYAEKTEVISRRTEKVRNATHENALLWGRPKTRRGIPNIHTIFSTSIQKRSTLPRLTIAEKKQKKTKSFKTTWDLFILFILFFILI